MEKFPSSQNQPQETVPEVKAEKNEDPFASSLTATDLDARTINLWQLNDDPSRLVRESKIQENQTLDELENSIREGEALFAQMRYKYGIKVVSMNSRREKNKEGEETIFTFVDKINGESLAKVRSLPIEARDELEGLYLSLGNHYYDAWRNNELYWADFQDDQFMYGNKVGDKDKHFYLIDVGAQFYKPGQSKRVPETNEEMHPLEWMLYNICQGLVTAEGKFLPKTRFDNARNQLSKEIDKMLSEKPNDKWLLESKNLLES